MAFWNVVILLAVVIGLASLQVPVLFWAVGIGTVLFIISLLGHLAVGFLVICWLLFIVAVGFATLTRYRQKYFVSPLMQNIKQRLPTISDTEREAIEAGQVWWEKDLFCGRPEWKKLLTFPAPRLSQEEKAFLDNEVDTLCSKLDDWQIVSVDHDMSPEVWEYLKSERFFGMAIPKEYGGRGFSALAHSTVVCKLATRSISVAVNTMVPNSLGPGELLVHYGTQEQKDYYLPRLAVGEEIPCFGLTGPEAGSDAGAITDSGVVCEGMHEGQKTLGIRLNWDKRYITLAPVATLLGIAVRLYDPDKLLGKVEDIGITLVLVPANHPGVETGNRHLPMHVAFMNGPTRGKDVFVPLDWIIGGQAMAGQGWRMLMECLSIGRSISLPALSTACGKLSYRMTSAYALIRRQFNSSIANFEGIEAALGDIAGYTYLLESCRIMTAGAVDLQLKPAIASAIAKYNMTEMARTVLERAMDIHAGHMIQVGPRNYLAHAHMTIPVSITVEGANILTRNLIIFGQGSIRCHPYIYQEIQLVQQKETDIAEFDKLLLSHLGYTVSNIARNIFCGLTGGIFLSSPVKGPTARYFKQLTRMSAALAMLSDLTMIILGGALKRKESLSARLGDMLSQLYLGSAVLKYYQDNGHPDTDLEHVKWSLDKCLQNLQIACDEILDNYPIGWLGKVLRAVIFPWGTAYRKPKDYLTHKVVTAMLQPSEFRDRITQYCYAQANPEDSMGRTEIAFAQLAKVEPILKKFHKFSRSGKVHRFSQLSAQLEAAIGAKVLSAEEAAMLTEYNALAKEVIRVDEFSFDLKEVKT